MGILKLKNTNFTNAKTQSDINIDRVVISNKVPFGKKCFKYVTGYKDSKKAKPLCIILPKMSAYSRRDFDETKYVSFLIKHEELLENYNEIWDKVSNSMEKGFHSEPVYNEKHVKIKIKSYEEKITNFHGNKVP